MTQAQEWLLKKVREAGPDGLYIGMGYYTDECNALVEDGLCAWRTVEQLSDTTVGVRDPRPCKWTDYYLVAK